MACESTQYTACSGNTEADLRDSLLCYLIDILKCQPWASTLLKLLGTINCELNLTDDRLKELEDNTLAVADTATVDMVKSGSWVSPNDVITISANVKKSAQANNSIVLNSDGVFSPDTTYTATDTTTVDTTVTQPSVVGGVGTIKADVKISSTSGNALTSNSTGLYVPDLQPQIDTINSEVDELQDNDIAVSDTATVDMVKSGSWSGTGDTITLSANTKISTASNNALTSDSTGLYATDTNTVTNLTASDTSTVDMTVSGGTVSNGVKNYTVSANTKISSASGNALSSDSTGLYVSAGTSAPYAVLESLGTFTKTDATVTHNDNAVVKIMDANLTMHTVTPTTVFTDRTIGSIDWSANTSNGDLTFITLPNTTTTTNSFSQTIKPGRVIPWESGVNEARIVATEYVQTYVTGDTDGVNDRYLVTIAYNLYVNFANNTAQMSMFLDNAVMKSNDSGNNLSVGSDGSLFYQTPMPDTPGAYNGYIAPLYDQFNRNGIPYTASNYQASKMTGNINITDRNIMKQLIYGDSSIAIGQIDNPECYPKSSIVLLGFIQGSIPYTELPENWDGGGGNDLAIPVKLTLNTSGQLIWDDALPCPVPSTFTIYDVGETTELSPSLPRGSQTYWSRNSGETSWHLPYQLTVSFPYQVWSCSYSGLD